MEETVLKSFPSLQSAKKRIIIQVTALGAGLLILGVALWLSGHRRFILDLPLGETVKGLKNSDVVIDWEEEEIPVESYEVRYIMTMQKSLTVISISMLPEKAGEYRMTVKDTHGQFLAGDLIEIGRFQSAFSWETGSFTGSEFILFCAAFCDRGIYYYADRLPEIERSPGKLQRSDFYLRRHDIFRALSVLCVSLLLQASFQPVLVSGLAACAGFCPGRKKVFRRFPPRSFSVQPLADCQQYRAFAA